jgi:hypothetical protein
MMIIKVAAIALATLANCGNAQANVVLSCSGIMEGPGLRRSNNPPATSFKVPGRR